MEPETRRFVPIMFSHIAGNTTLMGEDEERAVRTQERRSSPTTSGSDREFQDALRRS